MQFFLQKLKDLQLNNFFLLQVITRLMRYFEDLTWETASDIVENALVNEVALVRIVNNLNEATLAIGKMTCLKVKGLHFSRVIFLY